jgi:adenine deaminase
MFNKTELLEIARGEAPADLVIENARVVNVFSGRLESARVAIAGGVIAGLGDLYQGRETVDLGGRYLAPGFIEGHLHIESTLLSPAQLSKVLAPHGTTSVVADPHEIANVMGADGVRAMINGSENLPLTFFFTAPSCVPATHLETAGAALNAEELEKIAYWPRVLGLAELMNFPGAIQGDPEVLAKVDAFANKPIDGHAPMLSGPALNAYLLAGPDSDHECITLEEGREKLERGMYIMIRQGTSAKDMEALLPLVNQVSERRCMLVSDDRHPDDLFHKGHLDHLLRKAVKDGLDPISALRLVTINPAERFALKGYGAIAPGYRADLVELADLESFEVNRVWNGGKQVAESGSVSMQVADVFPDSARNSVHLPELKADSFSIAAKGTKARVIGYNPGSLTTDHLIMEVPVKNGLVRSDADLDLALMAVVERHGIQGRIGHGLIKGLGLKKGALASSVSHDSHNLVVAGMDEQSMLSAAKEVGRMGGGLAIADGNEILAGLPLPYAGLMSDAPVEQVLIQLETLRKGVKKVSRAKEPFMQMAFAALVVIPRLRLSDRGLVDVEAFGLVDLFVE